MDIAEVARRSGVPASTLRFYEEKALISSIGRRGLRRGLGWSSAGWWRRRSWRRKRISAASWAGRISGNWKRS